jgi:hypothetical protein
MEGERAPKIRLVYLRQVLLGNVYRCRCVWLSFRIPASKFLHERYDEVESEIAMDSRTPLSVTIENTAAVTPFVYVPRGIQLIDIWQIEGRNREIVTSIF